MGVDVLDVLNIEKLKTGKTPYLQKVSKSKWVWTVPRGTLLIYDEVQSASGYKSQNGKILGLCKAYGLKVLMMSATVADTPLKFRAIGYLLGLHQWKNHYSWCLNHGCYQSSWGGLEFVQGPQRLQYLKSIHDSIFPAKGNRIRIADLDVFPENSVFAEAYDLDQRSTDEINAIYEEMDADVLNPESDELPIVLALRARQKTELLKVPLIGEIADEFLEENKSVVIFVNFKETLDKLVGHFMNQPVAIIAGGQSQEFRDENIKMFQEDRARVCVAMIQAGGVGVSLHDTKGDYPRVALLSPAFNANHIKQALGRIHRAGGKTKCIQKIIFAASTVEEKACKAVKRKLENLSMLNDGDLTSGLFDDEEKNLSS